MGPQKFTISLCRICIYHYISLKWWTPTLRQNQRGLLNHPIFRSLITLLTTKKIAVCFLVFDSMAGRNENTPWNVSRHSFELQILFAQSSSYLQNCSGRGTCRMLGPRNVATEKKFETSTSLGRPCTQPATLVPPDLQRRIPRTNEQSMKIVRFTSLTAPWICSLFRPRPAGRQSCQPAGRPLPCGPAGRPAPCSPAGRPNWLAGWLVDCFGL